MEDPDYLKIARSDLTWRQITASFAIEGMAMSEAHEMIVGRLIAGEIDLEMAVKIISADANNAVTTDKKP